MDTIMVILVSDLESTILPPMHATREVLPTRIGTGHHFPLWLFDWTESNKISYHQC